MPEPTRPYRDALTRTVGVTLFVGLVVAVIDGVLAARAVPDASPLRAIAACIALYAWPALAAGVGSGLILGAAWATFGIGAPGRLGRALRADRARDIEATAALIAGLVVALIAVGFVALLAMKLVAGVERKSIGALLVGGLTIAALPAFVLLALPFYRLARAPARVVPALGPLPGVVVLGVLGSLAALSFAAVVVAGRLDWRVLNLGPYVVALGFAFACAVLGALVAGPLGRLTGRVPAVVAAVAAAIALVLPVLILTGTPTEPDVAAVAGESSGARTLVAIGRALRDGDGDGFSGFYGGPDCDDGRAAVHPDAPEVPGNSIDDNCIGGDRAAEPATPDPAVDPTPAAAPRITFKGNLVLIAIDTLRADRLGAAGYRRDGKSLTPNLDKLIGDSVYFERAWAQSPNTPRSFPSLFASRYPSQVAVDKAFANYPNPAPDNTFLFEVLSAGGIATRGHASHFYFERAPGFVQGFDQFDNAGALDIAGSNKDIAAPRIVPRAIASLDELGKAGRFAMFVHLFEPHSTYLEHEGFPITEKGTAALEQKYDYEIAFVDRWVGTLLDAIDKAGRRDDTMIVVVADHGEAFGVHKAYGQKMFFHGQTLYDELLRVPVIVRLPGVAPRKVADPIALVDVAPTIVEAMGLPRAPSFVGRSLVGALLGEALPARPLFAELRPAPSWDHEARAMVSDDGKHKLIHKDGVFELYDIAADPEERRDLAATDGKTLAAMKEALVRFIEVDLAP